MDSLTRIGISTPSSGRTDTADVPRDVRAIAVWADANAVFFGQGTFAARPVSTGGSPGKQGRIYMATDLTPHTLYYDYGTGWDPVGSVAAGSIGTTQLADGSVTGGSGAGAKIAAATITAANIANDTITATQIAAQGVGVAELTDTIKPSAGASNATEGLRAIGTGTGQVAPGIHASQHGPAGADPLAWTSIAASGTYASRPTATTALNGTWYYATDQVALYLCIGAAWVRMSEAAGNIDWTAEASARTGWLLLQGQAWPATTGIYADLFAKIGGSYPSVLPDVQGREFVAKGTHTDVASIGLNDGLAVANRRPKHKHNITVAQTISRVADVLLNDPGHSHLYQGPTPTNANGFGNNVFGQQQATGSSTTGITVSQQPGYSASGGAVGPQTGAEPLDSAAYIVLQPQIKL